MKFGRKTTLGCGAVLGTIVLGAIGSGVWEMVARPGVSKFGHFVLFLFTFGSQRLKDVAYAAASLDPHTVAVSRSPLSRCATARLSPRFARGPSECQTSTSTNAQFGRSPSAV